MLKLRETHGDTAKGIAKQGQDVTIDKVEALAKASNLIGIKYPLFKKKAEKRFKDKLWSHADQIVVKSSKTKYFFAVPGLLDDVAYIIRGLQPEPLTIHQEDCWDWGEDEE